VAEAEGEGIALDAVPDTSIERALRAADDVTAVALAAEPGIGEEIRRAASVEGAIETCDVVGGTAPKRVAQALADARERLGSS
jgi:argininosuccinate lyase